MKHVFLLIALIFSIKNICFAQLPTIQWQNNYGLSGDEVARSIAYSNLGFYILAGTTDRNGSDASIFKVDTSGNLLWSNSYGGSHDEQSYQSLVTFDNKIVFIGEANSVDGDVFGVHGNPPGNLPDYWLVCLDTSGTIEWQKCLGGSFSDQGFSVVQTPDSGFFITGTISDDNGDVDRYIGSDDVWVVKTDKHGNLMWRKTIGGTDSDFGNKCILTSDGGFLIAATTASTDVDVIGNHGSVDAWIVKLNSQGIIQWKRTYGGSGPDLATDILQGLNGSYYLIGTTGSLDGDISGVKGSADMLVIKIDSVGNILWQKCVGGSFIDEGRSGCVTSGGVQVIGYSWSNDFDAISNHGNKDVFAAEFDSSGNLLWVKCFGGSADDEGFSILTTSDGGSIFSGYTSSTDGDAIGNFSNNHRDWLVKLSPLPVAVEALTTQSLNLTVIKNGNSTFISFNLDKDSEIKMSFYDMLGRNLFEKKVRGHLGENQILLDISLPAYNCNIIQLETENGVFSKLIY